jgi:deoxyribodipyrimidine photo-lyase
VTALVWYRRDLRVHDHLALAAAREHESVVPVFCLDDRLLHGRHESGPRTQFLLEALRDLAGALRDRGSGLVVRHGAPERELAALSREVGATEVHATADGAPYAVRRDRRVGEALAAAGAALRLHPGLTAVDDAAALRTRQGRPYTVFTPFHRAWLEAPRRPVLAPPDDMPDLPRRLRRGRIPSLGALGLEQEVAEPLVGGERAARERLDAFLDGPVRAYGDGQDALGRPGTSRLSADLHLGTISPREVEARLPGGRGADAFRRQLCWRDFYQQVLHHFPENARLEFQARYRGTLEWNPDQARFEAWCDGRTGYPLVDAGMRQLRREGWMHNRARLVVASFLTKDLAIDWRWGERHFMRLLLDGDEAINNGNWQWIASVGVDPQPAFRRVYNPARHQERHDPDGAYVRRYVPELRPVPDRHLAEPWTMPPELQRELGCVIGVDYPEPIVDHAEARRATLARYGAARATG